MKTKINKYSNQDKLLLNIDWLTLNVQDNFVLMNDKPKTYTINGFLIEKVDKQTAHFKQMAYVWKDQEKFAVVTYDSRTHILKGRAHVKIENIHFYNGKLKALYEAFVQAFDLSSVFISRIDLAVDGVYFHKFVSDYEINKNKLQYLGKGRDLGYFRHDDRGNCHPVGCDYRNIALNYFDSFVVGSYGNKSSNTGKSSRFARYYNKSKELTDLDHKKYIQEYFEKNGFQGDVYRFEIEIRSEFIAQINGFKTSDIFDFKCLESLFRTGLQNFFEWRKKTDKNVSRCEKIELFQQFTAPGMVRSKKEITKTLRPVQQMVKRLIVESVELLSDWTNSKIVLANNYLTTIRTLVNEYSLQTWLNYKWSYLVDELEHHMNVYKSSMYKIPDYQLKANFYGA